MGDKKDADIAVLWQSARLRITDQFTIPPEILNVGDSVIGTLGNFSASIGKAKSKKTFNVSAIVAAAMVNGTVLRYRASLPEDKLKILYIDTEQSPYHCQRVMRRILCLVGLPLDKEPQNLEFIALRRFTPEIRIAIIEKAIYQTEGLGLVIIDGIRDLAYDINSPSEATNLISKLMQWTDERQIHIHTVLHQNKGDDNARGHIGTELNNKAETVLQVAKDEKDKEVSVVSAVHIRDIEFDKFAFRINDNALPELADDYVLKDDGMSKGFSYTELTEEQHHKALTVTFSEQEVMGYSVLLESLAKGYSSIGCDYGRNKIVKLKTFLCNKRMIVQENKKYKYNPDFHY
jgi:hypothetical protein